MSQSSMRMNLIILPSPLLYQDPVSFEIRKDFSIQKLIPEITVKRFDITTILGIFRPNIPSYLIWSY